MNLTRRAEYALRATIDLAVESPDARALLRDIAERQRVPDKYLEQLMRLLRNAGVVSSVRGSHGGYQLTRDPSEITLLEVIEAVEGRLGLNDDEADADSAASSVVVQTVWEDVAQTVRERLTALTVRDLAQRYREQQRTTDDWVI